MLYFTGPTKAECVPIRNNAASSTTTLPVRNANAPSAMMATSAAFTMRRMGVFS